MIGVPVASMMTDPLPDTVSAWARTALEDTLAVLVAGTRTPLYEAVLTAARHHPGPVPAIGTSTTTSPLWAAHLGAVAASALDFDDGHYRGGGIHAGSTVVPVLLAAAGDVTVGELLRGMVAGYEVALRAGFLNSPGRTGGGYRASGYAATIGAAAALAAVRGNVPTVISAAVRTAFAHAPHSRMTSSASRESIGWAAASAVAAVELAENGFGTEATDTRHRAPAGATPFEQSEDAPVTGSLGREFWCVETYVKPWPCCRAAHAMLEALLPFSGRDIARVDVDVVPGAVGLDLTEPVNLSEAQYALPWLAALTLLRGPAGLSSLSERDFAAPDIVDLASRVRLRPGRAASANGGYPSRVVVLMNDGTSFERTVDDTLGSATRPLSPEALDHKLRQALGSRLDASTIETLRATLDQPDAPIDGLLRLLTT